jgi:hypothetical protein
MSGEETDNEGPAREKRLVRVPVQWINPDLMHLFHTVDTWKTAVDDEDFRMRGNRPFTRLSKSKEPASVTATKRLPRNWYNDVWFKSQSDPKKTVLGATAPRPIPSLVSFFPFILMETLFAHTLPATLPETSLTLMR